MLKKASLIACVFAFMLMQTACQSFSLRKKSDRFAYLRKGKEAETDEAIPKGLPEPYEVIDIAVLDTSTTPVVSPTPPVVEDPVVEDPAPSQGLTTKAIQVVLNTAKAYIGTPYMYGGTGMEGIDCSGLVFSSFLSIEMTLPRTSRALANTGKVIKPKKIQPGDLVFFSSRNDGNINHVGLVTQVRGDEVRFIHATVSKGVREDRLDVGYWSERFIQAVRVS